MKPLPPAFRTMTPTALALAFGLASSATLAQTPAASAPIRIASQPLATALDTLASQAGLTLVVSPALLTGKSASPVQGAASPQQALQQMLAGTGLQGRIEGDRIVIGQPAPRTAADDQLLPSLSVSASADASAAGLSPAYAGGQVARGGRAGLLGTRDNLDTPFAITSYTNELIQNQQARSVAAVLQNDPSVRVARGFGNFQETYFIRGFIVSSDDITYNGLYGLLPRQYISSEIFERVEVLRGASAFLNGATPSGGGIGGTINLQPKRAPNEALSQVTAGLASGGQRYLATDVARRFGPDDSVGVRFNAAHRNGDTAVDREHSELSVASLGLDWRGERARVSADVGYQNNRLNDPRPNVTPATTLTTLPRAPHNTTNYAQPWTHSYERDVFGSLRAEYDLNAHWTAWGALGARHSNEDNVLSGPTVQDATTGDATGYRFDNRRKDDVVTAELGMRGEFRTGPVSHTVVAGYAYYRLKEKNAYAMDFFNTRPNNIYHPIASPRPPISDSAFRGNDLSDPGLLNQTRLTSLAISDTLGLADDRLLLTIGVRHQAIVADNYAYDTGARQSPYDKTRISPVAGAVFKWHQGLSLYANYIEGLSKGDSAPSSNNGVPVLNAGEQLKPYVSKQKEIGMKYDGGRIGGSLAFFTTEKPRSLVNGEQIFTAAGRDRHRGLELSVFGEAARGLRVLGGLTLLDAEQRATGDAATDGNKVIGVPRRQGNLGVEWDVPGLAGLTLNGRVVATGATYANAANTLRAPGWSRLDVGARYLTEWQGRVVTFRANVDNLTDRDYWASVGGYPNNGYLVLGTPRTITVSASIDF